MVEKYSDSFEPNIGLSTTVKTILHIIPGIRSIFSPKIPLPHSATLQLEVELDRLGQLGILGKMICSA